MNSGNSSISAENASLPNVAKHLWSTLCVLQMEFNSLARQSPINDVNEAQSKLLCKCLDRIGSLLESSPEIASLVPADITHPLTATEAILLIGKYKAALKTYRVKILGEDPFTITL